MTERQLATSGRSEEKDRYVLHVMRTYGVHGGERQLAQLFRVPKEGYRECFLFLYRDPDCEALYRQIGHLVLARLWPFPVRPRYSPWLELVLLLPILPILQARLIWFLVRNRCRACVVHGFQAALVAWPAACIFRSIGFAYIHRGTKSAAGHNPVFRAIYAPFRVAAGVSQAVTDSLAGLVKPDRLLPLENGIDWRVVGSRVEQCRRERGPCTVISTVGRLLPHKGHDLILAGFAEVLAKHAECELWIIGDGTTLSGLEALAVRMSIVEHVRFVGRSEDVFCLLGKSHIYVHASEIEGMSNAVLEAMAAGLPSVVMDAPGVSECHVNGETGFVVSRSVDALAEKLANLVEQPELRKRLGIAAQARVQHTYSIEANRARYVELYRRLETC